MDTLAALENSFPEIAFKTPADFGHRDSGFHPQNLDAGLMAIPESTGQISRLLAFCNTHRIGVVCQGGRTGLSGGAATQADQVILDTSRLNKIINIDNIGGTVTVECGVTLGILEKEANRHGLSCGIDLAARDSATIGGMVATNAGGIEAFRRGVMRSRVLGLEAVLADGSVMTDLKHVSKANEGVDVKQLFIGAEGTLGIVSKVVLSLVPMDPPADTLLISCDNAGQAVEVFRSLHNHHEIELLCAELMWPDYARTVASATGLESVLDFDAEGGPLFLLLETTRDEAREGCVENYVMSCIEKGSVRNAVFATSASQRESMWRIREDSFVVDRVYPDGLWFDMSVPLNRMADYADNLFTQIDKLSKDLKLFLFAHLGDGNFHATVSAGHSVLSLETEIKNAVYEGLNEAGGSFSAEHGIGLDKKDAVQKYVPAVNLKMMQQIKETLDPNGIMNPGKIL